MTISSYPSIFNLGHKAVQNLLKTSVIAQEKVDGSQFSFCKTEDGELVFRSKGAEINPDDSSGMFSKGVAAVKEVVDRLTPGWVYRGEYLRTPRHNALAYDRVPKGHVILFDVNPGLEEYLPYGDVVQEADRLGFEVVPLLFIGKIETHEEVERLLQATSVLGGQKIEGVVIKPKDYNLYGQDKKVLMGKFVSEAFKEVHRAAWKNDNPGQKDIIERLGLELTTPARWQKAVQHLRERGEVEDSPKDIGKLIPEVIADVQKECEDAIKQRLFDWAWKDLKRKVIAGLPEWYKEELLKKQFEEPAA